MKNISILDCTLRDGGRVFDCAFLDNEIKQIAKKLADSKIDIVEVGFLRDKKEVEYKGNSTFFTDTDQIKPFLDKSKNCMYVAFIDYGMFDFNSLKPFDGKSIDGLRIGFTKKDFENNLSDIFKKLEMVKTAGYKLFIQTVNTLNYSDDELLGLIKNINKIQPYSFGIVDTYGAMYVNDVTRIYYLIDNNLNEETAIDFHSHNNYQLSFAFAQEIIKLSNEKRRIIIDATLHGMGKCAGNLNTELIVDYMIRNLNYDYDLDIIFDVIDEYIYDYQKKYSWGYSIPALMSGIYKAHPNNVIYLTEKFRLDTKDIRYIMAMIDSETRQRYDYDNIENLYISYISSKVDDQDTLKNLKSLIDEREVLVLAPGGTLVSFKSDIYEYIKCEKPFIISVNFVSDIQEAVAFFTNQKRYNQYKDKKQKAIITSNIKSDNFYDVIVNYESLITRNFKYFDNSVIMLLNLLRKIEIKKISIAGFDGYVAGKENYIDHSLNVSRHESEYDEYNHETMINFSKYVETVYSKCTIKFITPSMFEKAMGKKN
jgi:4-hydroxy 2-oxovalerate aldolase